MELSQCRVAWEPVSCMHIHGAPVQAEEQGQRRRPVPLMLLRISLLNMFSCVSVRTQQHILTCRIVLGLSDDRLLWTVLNNIGYMYFGSSWEMHIRKSLFYDCIFILSFFTTLSFDCIICWAYCYVFGDPTIGIVLPLGHPNKIY